MGLLGEYKVQNKQRIMGLMLGVGKLLRRVVKLQFSLVRPKIRYITFSVTQML